MLVPVCREESRYIASGLKVCATIQSGQTEALCWTQICCCLGCGETDCVGCSEEVFIGSPEWSSQFLVTLGVRICGPSVFDQSKVLGKRVTRSQCDRINSYLPSIRRIGVALIGAVCHNTSFEKIQKGAVECEMTNTSQHPAGRRESNGVQAGAFRSAPPSFNRPIECFAPLIGASYRGGTRRSIPRCTVIVTPVLMTPAMQSK